MQSLDDTKYRNRAKLEKWLHDIGGTAEYLRNEDGWTVRVEIAKDPETWIVTSGPHDSIETGCASVMDRFREAGQSI